MDVTRREGPPPGAEAPPLALSCWVRAAAMLLRVCALGGEALEWRDFRYSFIFRDPPAPGWGGGALNAFDGGVGPAALGDIPGGGGRGARPGGGCTPSAASAAGAAELVPDWGVLALSSGGGRTVATPAPFNDACKAATRASAARSSSWSFFLSASLLLGCVADVEGGVWDGAACTLTPPAPPLRDT